MKKALFQGVSGEVVFPKGSFVEKLVSLQNSSIRACYKFLRREPKATDIEVYRAVKPRYLDFPTRYFMSGLVTARQLSGNAKVVFGGRKNKRRYDAGEISRDCPVPLQVGHVILLRILLPSMGHGGSFGSQMRPDPQHAWFRQGKKFVSACFSVEACGASISCDKFPKRG